MSHATVRRIGLISNRNSGHNRDQFDRIEQLVAACPQVHHVPTHSVDDIVPALAQLARLNIDVLAINGGDGTVSAILGHMLERRMFSELPPVIVLPGGTANMNAGDVGATGKLLTTVGRFCAWAEGDISQRGQERRALMRVQVGDSDTPRYGMFFGTGAIMQGTEYAHREIHSRGLRDDFSVALGTVRTIWGLVRRDPDFCRPSAVSVRLDEQAQASDHLALIMAISSLQRLFFGMRPFWGRQPAPLQLTIIENDCTRFLSTFISIARGKPNQHATPAAGYHSHNAHQVSLNMQGAFNLDGEIIDACEAGRTVTITATEPVTFIRL